MNISFLIHNGYGIGGTIRTTFNLAQTLAEHHDVEIVSVFRHRERPVFDLDPRVRVRHLVDLREEGDDPRMRRPAKVFPASESRHRQYSELTDERIGRHLADTDADVVVGTRPGLNVHLALQGPARAVRVGQEHLTLDTHSQPLRRDLRRVYPRLDALTTVTEADARSYRRKMRLPGVRVEALPNSVPAPAVAPVDGHGRVVIAAGRLARVKRYDLLIRAFGKVAAERPDWSLRIYGSGDEGERLRRLVEELGLYNNVFLMGRAAPMEAEWVKGSIGAVSSSFEGFGMTIVEAMRCGLPVVSTACPLGPPEIIEDGVDGRLVPPKDPDALAAGLLELINDDVLRQRMGRAARVNAQRFDPAPVAERCDRLFTDLRRGSGSRRRRMRGALLSGLYTAKDRIGPRRGAAGARKAAS
jgi:glycosyltransferase involved in cell wall biosynthesis